MMTTVKRAFALLALLLMSLVLLAGCQSVESDEQGPLNNLYNFTAYTMKGDTFTQDEFAEYDLNILFFWAPWSDASIYELKQMVALSEDLPENVSFTSVCLDSDLKESKAKLKELNLKGFKTLEQGNGDFKTITDAVVNVPTTVIFDKAGNLIGDPVIGIQENPEKEYVSILNSAMKQIGGKKISLDKKDKNAKKDDADEDSEESEKSTEESSEEEDTDDTEFSEEYE